VARSNSSGNETGTVVRSTSTVGGASPVPRSTGDARRPGSHCTKLSPMRPSGWIVQRASRGERRHGRVDEQLHAGLEVGGQADVEDLARAGAGDLDQLAGEQPLGGVEHDVDAVARARVVPAPGERDARRDDRDEGQGREQAPHGLGPREQVVPSGT
jgi:hypothetical protein